MISIIIPTLNEEKIIESTLCTLASTLTIPHEVIVSDGGSSDRTVELAKKYARTVVVFSGPDRQTIAQGRNDGARIALGDFFVFLDADCVIPEPNTFFTRALEQFQKHPELVALTANLRVFQLEETFSDKLMFGAANLGLRLTNNVFNRGEAFGEFQMVRKEAFIRLGGFREDLVTREDADLFRRLSKSGKTMIDPRLTVLHSGRRAHQVGWPRLIFTFIVNTFFVSVFNRAFSKEWKPIR